MRITEEYISDENRTIELGIPEIMLIVLVLVTIEQTVILKNIVSDLG